MVKSLFKFINSSNNSIQEEVLLSLGHILSDVKYKDLKYYNVDSLLKIVYEVLFDTNVPFSLIQICFNLILNISRGKLDIISAVK